MKMDSDVDLAALAKDTHGYVGADISQLTMEAALECIRRNMDKLDLDGELDAGTMDGISVSKDDLAHALKVWDRTTAGRLTPLPPALSLPCSTSCVHILSAMTIHLPRLPSPC